MLETDEKGRIKLSMTALIERPEGMAEERYEPRGDRNDRPPRRDRDDRPPRRDREDRPRRDATPAEGGVAGGGEPQAASPSSSAPEAPKPTE